MKMRFVPGELISRQRRVRRAAQMVLQCVEPRRPLGSVRLQPRVELHQRLGAQSVHPPLGIPSDLHQPGIPPVAWPPGSWPSWRSLKLTQGWLGGWRTGLALRFAMPCHCVWQVGCIT